MKKFSELREKKTSTFNPGGPAADLVPEMDDDDEVTNIKPRSKGEQDFAAKHSIEVKAHPVARDNQFSGDSVHVGSHKGAEDKSRGETALLPRKFKEVRGGIGKSSYRSADKTQGQKPAVLQGSSKVKENFVPAGKNELADGTIVEIDEDISNRIEVVLNDLSEDNREIMRTSLAESETSFNAIVEFVVAQTE